MATVREENSENSQDEDIDKMVSTVDRNGCERFSMKVKRNAKPFMEIGGSTSRSPFVRILIWKLMKKLNFCLPKKNQKRIFEWILVKNHQDLAIWIVNRNSEAEK